MTVAAFAGEAKKSIDKIRDNASKAADNTNAIIDELATWREWVQKLAANKKATTPVPLSFAPVQETIVKLWEDFNAQPADCEDATEPSGWRTHKRTYNEFLHLHGNDHIRGWKLIGLTPDATTLERVIHNAKEKKRQKKAAAKSPQARRKK